MSLADRPDAELGITYLRERGITNSTIQQHRIEIATNLTSDLFRSRLGFDALQEGKLADLATEVVWFPCRNFTGKQVSWIARPLPAIGDPKFLNPKGGAYPFIPLETWEAKDKSNKPLIPTEGPVKALALVQTGCLAIGVNGVWMATSKEPNGSVELVPALSEFVWSGRVVYLAFDADSATNSGVKQALMRTWLTLYKQGAKIRCLTLPLSQGKGVDDYLYAKQQAGEEPARVLEKLTDDAREPDASSMLDHEDLTMMKKELVTAHLDRSGASQLSRLLAGPLKVKASALEADIFDNDAESNKAFELTDPEPWPHCFDGAKLVAEIVELLRHHVVMSEEQAVAAALWIFLTYLEASVDVLPILAVTSPEKRCGKSTLLSILRAARA